MRLVRYASWYLAALLTALGLALAAAIAPNDDVWPGANARFIWMSVALVLAAIVLLLTRQRWSKYSGTSLLLALAAFPALLVPYERAAACSWRPHRPCMDRAIVAWHPGVRLAMFLVLLGVSLILATTGFLLREPSGPPHGLDRS